MASPLRSPLSSHNDNIPATSPLSAKLEPFPPSTPTDDTAPPPPSDPPPATPAAKTAIETLNSFALPILANEHRLSMPIWAGGNAAVAIGFLLDVNLVNISSWALLAATFKGFAVSVVSPAAPAPSQLTVEQLQPYLTQLVAAFNSAREMVSRVFTCTDARLSLRAAMAFYLATLVSARLSTHTIVWLAFNLAFLAPAAIKSGLPGQTLHFAQQKLTDVQQHPKALQLAQAAKQYLATRPQLQQLAKALQQVSTPKAQSAGAAILWIFYFSWFHKVLSLGFGCLHLKAQGIISPNTEMQVGEAVGQIKKRARRMSIEAGAMLSRRPKAE